MWNVLARQDRDQVTDRSAENAFCGGELSVSVWCVAILEDGTLKCICVEATIAAGVVDDHSLYGLHTNFCPAVAVRECYRREAMMNSPVAQKCQCGCGCKFRTTVRRELIANPKCCERAPEAGYETFGSLVRSFHDRPVAVSVDDHQVVVSRLLEEVCTDTLKGVLGLHWWGRGSAWL